MRPSFPLQEPFSAVSHLLGAALGLAGLILLTGMAQTTRELMTASVYGVSIVALFLASGLTHAFGPATAAGRRWERFDRAAIFLFIAGTYTPICLLVLPSAVGATMLALEWLMAFTGIWMVFTGHPVSKRRQVAVYLAMGWLFLPTVGVIAANLSDALLGWLLAGAVLYSVGAAIYLGNRPHLSRRYFTAHDLWHLLVLGGSACHFVMVTGIVGG